MFLLFRTQNEEVRWELKVVLKVLKVIAMDQQLQYHHICDMAAEVGGVQEWTRMDKLSSILRRI
jgi:hypothetical protein